MDVTLNDLAKMRRAVYLPFAMRTVFCQCNFLSCLILGFSLAAAYTSAGASAVYFTASDFSVVILPEQASVQPGQIIYFDAILYNHSSQPANFSYSGNIKLVGVSCSPEIDGNNLLYSPYISSVTFTIALYQTIAPGGQLQVPFMNAVTLPSIPVGSVVTTGTGNWIFQNVPPSTSNPNADFFIPMPAASETVVPEPGTLLLAGLPLLIIALGRVRGR